MGVQSALPQTGSLGSAVCDESALAEFMAELHREIETQACARFGADRSTEGSDGALAAVHLPSAPFWIETRKRVFSALTIPEPSTPSKVETSSPQGVRGRVRAKLRFALAKVRSGVRSMEQRLPQRGIRARCLALAKRLWRTLKHRAGGKPPALPLAPAVEPTPPTTLAMLELLTALQCRDQSQERDKSSGHGVAAPACAVAEHSTTPYASRSSR